MVEKHECWKSVEKLKIFRKKSKFSFNDRLYYNIIIIFMWSFLMIFTFEIHYLPNFLADCPTNYIESSFEKVQLKGFLILPKMCV